VSPVQAPAPTMVPQVKKETIPEEVSELESRPEMQVQKKVLHPNVDIESLRRAITESLKKKDADGGEK